MIGGYRDTENQPTPAELLESQRIVWRRDWDALVLGFVLGVLCTSAAMGLY